MARQMTLMDYHLLSAIPPRELCAFDWTDFKRSKSLNIIAMVTRFNEVKYPLQAHILPVTDSD